MAAAAQKYAIRIAEVMSASIMTNAHQDGLVKVVNVLLQHLLVVEKVVPHYQEDVVQVQYVRTDCVIQHAPHVHLVKVAGVAEIAAL